MNEKGYIDEVFSSFQGEGLCLGTRQLFVRLSGCNIQCDYCDNNKAIRKCQYFRIEFPPGSFHFKKRDNPISVDSLLRIIDDFIDIPHQYISFTGGEPLYQADFLAELLPPLIDRRHKIYLETNGTLPEELEKIGPFVDITAMDFKLESTTGTPTPWEVHKKFLEISYGFNSGVFVKLIISPSTPMEEIIESCRIIAKVSPSIPLVFQPLTDSSGINFHAPTFLKFQQEALRIIQDVRIIPQTHKIVGKVL